ncbi:hypothetical protein [Agrobacterium larrymoorei]|uniref:EamA/RhaT family transporter n=1 Tax=Agrobacterium larrymoorei TaxID=160699 RepID=A0ABU0UKT1_9HYPH|nr:hypothetical protein [Agrobacterium larrymoorei]MDQ1185565.1 hypothetical protein [Agrobacterium larrymoorei]
MNRNISNALLSGLRMFIMASVFLGPFAGLAIYKADPRPVSKGAGFVLLMSLQRGAIG